MERVLVRPTRRGQARDRNTQTVEWHATVPGPSRSVPGGGQARLGTGAPSATHTHDDDDVDDDDDDDDFDDFDDFDDDDDDFEDDDDDGDEGDGDGDDG